jgi:hypothetical protein
MKVGTIGKIQRVSMDYRPIQYDPRRIYSLIREISCCFGNVKKVAKRLQYICVFS